MNRYTADRVIEDSLKGRRVVVVCDSMHHARHALAETAERVERREEPFTIYRANGRERIIAPGGGDILFRTRRSRDSFRGLTADIVFIDGYDAAYDYELFKALRLVVMASPHGEIIRP